jgi:hypothetical protein
MQRKLSVMILTAVLLLSMGFSAHAETGAAGNTDANYVNQGNNMNNMYRTTAADHDVDWGWVGLLGLAGLAGLAGRNRNQNPGR